MIFNDFETAGDFSALVLPTKPPGTPFDSTMPALSLAPTAPGDLRSVQTWSKVASAKEIEKY